MAKQAFDRTELKRIFGCNKTRGPSGRLHPGRPADSVDVIFWAIGQIKIDHMADIGHIDSACCNIGRDEYTKRPTLKAIKSTSAL